MSEQGSWLQRVPLIAGALAIVSIVAVLFLLLLIRSWRSRHAATVRNERRIMHFGAGRRVRGTHHDIDDVARPLLGRKSLLMGMLTSGFVIANAAQPSSAAAGTIKPIAASPPPLRTKVDTCHTLCGGNRNV